MGYARVSRFGGDADEQRAAAGAGRRCRPGVPRRGSDRDDPPTTGPARSVDRGLAGATRWWPRRCLGWRVRCPDAHELLNGLAAGEVTLAIGENFYPASLPVTHVLVEVGARTAQLPTGLDSRGTRVAWPPRASEDSSGAGHRSSTTDRNATSPGSTRQVTTRSARSVSCSPSPAQPSTAPSGEPTAPLTQMPLTAQVSQPRDAANTEHGRRNG